MQTRTMPPIARTDELVIEELGDELLVYDLIRDEAHSLGAVAARVWNACDGRTTLEGMTAELDLDHATVTEAVEGLRACNLLDEGPQDDGVTRRGFTLRTLKIGAVATAAPLIVSVAAPAAAMAVTEAFCQSISVTGHGCGDCHKFGCCCCEPPGTTSSSVTKPCHADCTSHPQCNQPPTANCNGSTANCKEKGF